MSRGEWRECLMHARAEQDQGPEHQDRRDGILPSYAPAQYRDSMQRKVIQRRGRYGGEGAIHTTRSARPESIRSIRAWDPFGCTATIVGDSTLLEAHLT